MKKTFEIIESSQVFDLTEADRKRGDDIIPERYLEVIAREVIMLAAKIMPPTRKPLFSGYDYSVTKDGGDFSLETISGNLLVAKTKLALRRDAQGYYTFRPAEHEADRAELIALRKAKDLSRRSGAHQFFFGTEENLGKGDSDDPLTYAGTRNAAIGIYDSVKLDEAEYAFQPQRDALRQLGIVALNRELELGERFIKTATLENIEAAKVAEFRPRFAD